jgi:hypothetical protein
MCFISCITNAHVTRDLRLSGCLQTIKPLEGLTVSYILGRSYSRPSSLRNDPGRSRDILAVIDKLVLRTKVLYKTRLLFIR